MSHQVGRNTRLNVTLHLKLFPTSGSGESSLGLRGEERGEGVDPTLLSFTLICTSIESVDTQTLSLVGYTLRYINLEDVVII